MRTLGEILKSAKGQDATAHTFDECYYAMLMLSALLFDNGPVFELVEAEERDERARVALDMSPTIWLSNVGE